MFADSTPTPMTGLSLSMLADEARKLAAKADRMMKKYPEKTSELAGISMKLGALASGFTELQHTECGKEEDARSALITELGRATQFLNAIDI